MSTYYIVSHSSFVATDMTFVPKGVHLLFYVAQDMSANRALNLAKMGAETFAKASAQDSTITLYEAAGEIPNYGLFAISDHDAMVAYAAIADEAAGWLRCMQEAIQFCTANYPVLVTDGEEEVTDAPLCQDGVHNCQGLFAQDEFKEGNEVHIVCCRLAEGEAKPQALDEGDKKFMQPVLELGKHLLELIATDTGSDKRFQGEAAALIDDTITGDPRAERTLALASSYYPDLRRWIEERSYVTSSANETSREEYVLFQDLEALTYLGQSALVYELPDHVSDLILACRQYYFDLHKLGPEEAAKNAYAKYQRLTLEAREYAAKSRALGPLIAYMKETHPTGGRER